jgi:hypothetical protein
MIEHGRIPRERLLVFLTLFALPPGHAAGAEWIVSAVCGDDATGDGSRARPLATIEAAVRRAAEAGDVIRVLPSGDLSGACPPLAAYPNTTLSKDLCVVAEAGPLETRSAGFTIDPDRTVTIRGFMITNAGGHGIAIPSGDDPARDERTTVENCVIDACGQDGIRIDNRSADMHFRLWARNCSILNSTGAGIRFVVSVGAFGGVTPPSATIENCIIKDNNLQGVLCVDGGENRGDGTTIIRHSYIGGNNSGGEQITLGDRVNVVIDHELFNPPIFQNELLCDYRLHDASTLRDQGNPNCLYLDPDGTRNDPGAFGGPGSLGFHPGGGPAILKVTMELLPGGRRVRVCVVAKE